MQITRKTRLLGAILVLGILWGGLTSVSLALAKTKYESVQVQVGGKSVQVYWPHYNLDIKVTSPNGGETWTKGETSKITWKVDNKVYTQWLKDFQGKNKPVWSDLSILPRELNVLAFLVKDGEFSDPVPPSSETSVYMSGRSSYFIGRANLLGGAMYWNVPNVIPSGKDYRIRLVVAFPTFEASVRASDNSAVKQSVAPILPWVISDESDRPFTIQDQQPNPQPVDVQELLKQIEELRREIDTMKQSMSRMDAILGRMERIIKAIVG